MHNCEKGAYLLLRTRRQSRAAMMTMTKRKRMTTAASKTMMTPLPTRRRRRRRRRRRSRSKQRGAARKPRRSQRADLQAISAQSAVQVRAERSGVRWETSSIRHNESSDIQRDGCRMTSINVMRRRQSVFRFAFARIQNCGIDGRSVGGCGGV